MPTHVAEHARQASIPAPSGGPIESTRCNESGSTYSRQRNSLRRATEALRESEARFRAIADDAPVMIWDTSFFSRLWLETTGQSEAEALGFGWVDVIHPEARRRARHLCEANTYCGGPMEAGRG